MIASHKGYILKVITVAICISSGWSAATQLPLANTRGGSVMVNNTPATDVGSYINQFGLTGLTAGQLATLDLPTALSLPASFQIYTAPGAGGYTQTTNRNLDNNTSANYANIIQDALTVNGTTSIYLNNDDTGKVVNVITGGLTSNSSGQVQFFSGTNIITGGIISNNSTLFLDNSTNFFTGGITADGALAASVVRFNTSTNMVSGDVTATNGGTVLGSGTNTIAGNITADGASTADSSISLTGTNNITGNISASNNGVVSLNSGGGPTTNNITGGIACSSGGAVYLSDLNGNGSTSTVDTVAINNGGNFYAGYPGSTTIGTLNWNNGGNFTLVIDSSQPIPVVPIDITTLNITGTPVLSIWDIHQGGTITSYSTTLNLMTVGNVASGSLTQVQLAGAGALQEITSVSYGANNLTITLQPAATTAISAAPGSANDAAFSAQAGVASVTGAMTTDPDAFRSTAKGYADAFRQFNLSKGKLSDEPEKLFKLLAAENQKPLVLPARANSKVWVAPYYTKIKNSGTLGKNGFNEHIYGALAGFDHWFESIKAAFGAIIGYGSSVMKMQRSSDSNVKGKQITTGFYMNKKFMENGLWMSSLNFIKAQNNQQRRGDPTPTSSYIATSKYKTETLTFTNDVSYVFKLNEGFSFRPNVGLALMRTKRYKFTEKAPSSYAQSYKNNISNQGELYGGLGFRQKWKLGEVENKLTFVYEIGRKNGTGLQKDTVYTQTHSAGVNISTPSAGRTTQYFNLYGSTSNRETGLKFTLGGTVIIQRAQKSYMGSLKMDIKF